MYPTGMNGIAGNMCDLYQMLKDCRWDMVALYNKISKLYTVFVVVLAFQLAVYGINGV